MSAPYTQHLFTIRWEIGDPTTQGVVLGDAADVYVIRTIDVYMPAGVASSFQIYGDDDAAIMAVAYPASDGNWEHWDGRQAFYPGQTIYFEVAGLTVGGASARATAYFLSNR